MIKNEPLIGTQSDIEQLLDLRFSTPDFRLTQAFAQPKDLTAVMQVYTDQLLDLGFIYSHEILVNQCIGKHEEQPARILAYMNVDQNGYALVTNLYHEKSWVYFTHYYADSMRIITTCQPGALQLEPMRELSDSADFILENTGSSTLATQWKKHLQVNAANMPSETALLMDSHQHLDAEREAYRKYTQLLLDCTILRQSDTQLVCFTQTGGRSYQAAITSKSARRPQPSVENWIGSRGKMPLRQYMNFRNAALLASAAVASVLVINLATYKDDQATSKDVASITPAPIATAPIAFTLPLTTEKANEKANDNTTEEKGIEQLASLTTDQQATADSESITTASIASEQVPSKPTSIETTEAPEQFIIASEEDEMWRIAVENAEFFLMSNDGDPAPWIRTARKMAAGFPSGDSRLARTYFLAALLERDPNVAEQQYNRALSIQTKSLGLYHAETAQTLEALAWIAEGSRDALEDAITHQRLALNIYRSIFGEEAEDTRAAQWKLQYFEDRLAGRRPKSDDNRRLLPALARFTR